MDIITTTGTVGIAPTAELAHWRGANEDGEERSPDQPHTYSPLRSIPDFGRCASASSSPAIRRERPMFNQFGTGGVAEVFAGSRVAGAPMARSGQLDALVALEQIGARRSSAFAASGNNSNCQHRRQRLPKCHHLAFQRHILDLIRTWHPMRWSGRKAALDHCKMRAEPPRSPRGRR